MKKYIIDPANRKKPVSLRGTPLGKVVHYGALIVCGFTVLSFVVFDSEEKRARFQEKFKKTEDMLNREAMWSSATMYEATLSMFAKQARPKHELPETNIDEPMRSSTATVDELI